MVNILTQEIPYFKLQQNVPSVFIVFLDVAPCNLVEIYDVSDVFAACNMRAVASNAGIPMLRYLSESNSGEVTAVE
jgi:hypothetical protein